MSSAGSCGWSAGSYSGTCRHRSLTDWGRVCNCGFLVGLGLTVRPPRTVNIALAVTNPLTGRLLLTVKKYLSLTQFIWRLSLGIAVPSAGVV
jgi:hypothetical protein